MNRSFSFALPLALKEIGRFPVVQILNIFPVDNKELLLENIVYFHVHHIKSTVILILWMPNFQSQAVVYWRLVLMLGIPKIIRLSLVHVSRFKLRMLKFKIRKVYSFYNFAPLEMYLLQILGSEHKILLEQV